MEQQQAKFEGWAIVEVFGHQRYAGFVTTEYFGTAAMIRVDVPPLAERERMTKSWEYVAGHQLPPGSTVKEEAVQGYTKLFGVGAIYGITPCDQAAAEKSVAAMQPRKLQIVKLAEGRAITPGDPIDADVDNDDELDEADQADLAELRAQDDQVP